LVGGHMQAKWDTSNRQAKHVVLFLELLRRFRRNNAQVAAIED
jgi:hypothetical protein